MTITDFVLARRAEEHERDMDRRFSEWAGSEPALWNARRQWERLTITQANRASFALQQVILAVMCVFPPIAQGLAQAHADHPDYPRQF